MSTIEWAKKEIDIVRELNIKDEKDEGLIAAINKAYDNMFKAYKTLVEDSGFSGFSYSFFAGQFIRLLKDMPLTPITEEDFGEEEKYMSGNYTVAQCTRYSALFRHKIVHLDGRETCSYQDVNRFSVYYINEGTSSWHNSFISRLCHLEAPIKMPYYPGESLPVACIEFCSTANDIEDNNDKVAEGKEDRLGILYFVKNGRKIWVNRYLDTTDEDSNNWKDIPPEQFSMECERCTGKDTKTWVHIWEAKRDADESGDTKEESES